ncbi:MAG: hypothetical protein J0653_01115 [Deltaproteobacteria bacterium]|nr:hypothetical protein [Deltaproteobacteria bacterium]
MQNNARSLTKSSFVRLSLFILFFLPQMILAGPPEWMNLDQPQGSLKVLLIGLVHGAVVVIAAVLSSRRWVLVTTTAVMLYIAVAFGNPRYVSSDIFFVVLGLYIGWKAIDKIGK